MGSVCSRWLAALVGPVPTPCCVAVNLTTLVFRANRGWVVLWVVPDVVAPPPTRAGTIYALAGTSTLREEIALVTHHLAAAVPWNTVRGTTTPKRKTALTAAQEAAAPAHPGCTWAQTVEPAIATHVTAAMVPGPREAVVLIMGPGSAGRVTLGTT